MYIGVCFVMGKSNGGEISLCVCVCVCMEGDRVRYVGTYMKGIFSFQIFKLSSTPEMERRVHTSHSTTCLYIHVYCEVDNNIMSLNFLILSRQLIVHVP